MLPPAALWGLVAGVAVLAASFVVPPPGELPLAGWRVLGLALMMAIWWSTEPVPIGVTSLLPLIVLPLAGIGDIAAAAASYGNPLVFLFLGGLMLAAAVQRWGLHARLAHAVVRAIGTGPQRLVLGFMLASALLSMWISNTAAVVLMLPVAVSVIAAFEGQDDGDGNASTTDTRRFALALLLGLAFGASIGGVGTLIGTPPNALLAGYLLDSHGIDLSFAAWSMVGLPLVAVFLPLAWLVLTRLVYPVAAAGASEGETDRVLADLRPGPLGRAEARVALVFAAAATLWMTRPLLNRLPGLEGLSDAGIALLCAGALYLIPAGQGKARPLLTWDEGKRIPWQVLLLFGGGLSLAGAMERSGLAVWIGEAFAAMGAMAPLLFLLMLAATVVMLTEIASNTAVVAAILPIVATIAAGSGMDVVVLAAAVAMAASCAFMLPAATPPNAIVFATGHVTVAAMIRAGVWLNLLSVTLVTLAALTLAPLLPGAG